MTDPRSRRDALRAAYRDELALVDAVCGDPDNPAASDSQLVAPIPAVGGDDWLKEAFDEQVLAARRGELDPLQLAIVQSRLAAMSLTQTRTVAGSWPWPDVEAMLGPLSGGTLTLFGGLTGNGKSTFLANWINALWGSKVGVYVLPTEERAEDYRLRLATYFLGYNFEAVQMERWDEVGTSKEQYLRDIQEALGFLARHPELAVSSIPRPSAAQVLSEIERAAKEFGAEIVVLDHFHRVRIEARDYRLGCADFAQRLKHASLKYNIAIVAACQLNRPSATDRLDRYLPPTLDRIRESSAIAEEADLAIMASRALRYDADPKALRMVKQGMAQAADVALPNTMQLTTRKHRRWGSQVDKHCFLAVEGGRLTNWKPIPRIALVDATRKVMGGPE